MYGSGRPARGLLRLLPGQADIAQQTVIEAQQRLALAPELALAPQPGDQRGEEEDAEAAA